MSAPVLATISPRQRRNADDVLNYAKGKLSECVVLGTDINGRSFIVACDGANDTPGALWLIESVKLALMQGEVQPFGVAD
jgi:hypothetical protein